MKVSDFRRAGHWPTLACAFIYFDVSFAVWVLLGALGNALAENFGLTPGQKGLMVAIPLLGGSLMRLVLGVLTDRIGARKTGLIGLSVTIVPLLLGWLWVSRFEQLLVVGMLLGVAGASFAVALPLASRWYPPQYQGLVLGIAGAGNSGTALATFFGPRLATLVGWQGVFGLALIPVLLTLVVFALYAKDSPTQPAPRPIGDYARVLRKHDTWWFCLFYGVTFGGFVGLASFLSIFFRDQYALDAVGAGNFTTLCVIAGSFVRPIGGYMADRIGGVKMLTVLYLGIAVLMLGMATTPGLRAGTVLLFAILALLGMGNGSVFQLVPQRFSAEIGVATGVVGAAGGLGGFLLPTLLGSLKGTTGSFAGGFLAFAVASAACSALLVVVARGWASESGEAPALAPAPVPGRLEVEPSA